MPLSEPKDFAGDFSYRLAFGLDQAREFLELDGAVVGTCLDEQRVNLVEHRALPNADRPGHEQDGHDRQGASR